MKRSLSFCAIALVAVMAHSATADINVQLNLRYDDPADESAGGTWELLAGSTGGGLAGLSALIDGINNDATAAGSSGFEVFESQQVGSVVEIVTGSDLAAPLDEDVGQGAGTTGNVEDDLFPGNSPAIWANNALLASGTFGSTRPSFLVTSGTLAAGANEFSAGSAVSATVANWTVRGDSVATDGLLEGDADRDGDVDINDFSLLSSNFDQAPTTWDQGNFNSIDGTNINDFSLLSGNFDTSATPPAIGAVPEPSSAVVLVAGLLSLAAAGRKR